MNTTPNAERSLIAHRRPPVMTMAPEHARHVLHMARVEGGRVSQSDLDGAVAKIEPQYALGAFLAIGDGGRFAGSIGRHHGDRLKEHVPHGRITMEAVQPFLPVGRQSVAPSVQTVKRGVTIKRSHPGSEHGLTIQ